MKAAHVLGELRQRSGTRLDDLPSSSGVYALRDHLGVIRYIGIAHSEGFRTRIRNKHSTGSEGRSHKLSSAYNSGRMWRDRKVPSADGAIAKRLRNAFILKHCTASVFPIPDYEAKRDLEMLERAVQASAAPGELAWWGKFPAVDEPVDLVAELIEELKLSSEARAALTRQSIRFEGIQ